jgi:molybdopterin/thiamine biosynthesis adenylyltransferase
MNDDQLLRYSRHILLDAIGVEGQQRLLDSHALVIGAGGLGSPVALYLGTAGVGRITLVDHDTVDVTNLQRQIAHNLARVGQPKAESARETIAAINPDVQVLPVVQRADAAWLARAVAKADVVLDCSDNFQTRQAVNAACVAARGRWCRARPSASTARSRCTTPDRLDAPCYACIFPPDATFEEVRCSTMGVFAPLVGIIGSMQAAEALKLLAGVGSSLAGRLQMLDARSMEWTEIRLAAPARSARSAEQALANPGQRAEHAGVSLV